MPVDTRVVGKMWVPEESKVSPNSPTFLSDEDDGSFDEKAETKVIRRRGRRPRRPTEGVETK